MSHFSHLPPVEYEKHDVSASSVSRTSILILALTVFSIVVAWGYFRWLYKADMAGRQAAAPAVEHPVDRVPPEPQLQRVPFDDVKALRRDEQKLLSRYRWVDAQAGVARIPIDEAMRIYVERAAAGQAAHPFPVVPLAPAAAASPAAVAHP